MNIIQLLKMKKSEKTLLNIRCPCGHCFCLTVSHLSRKTFSYLLSHSVEMLLIDLYSVNILQNGRWILELKLKRKKILWLLSGFRKILSHALVVWSTSKKFMVVCIWRAEVAILNFAGFAWEIGLNIMKVLGSVIRKNVLP